MSSDSDEDNARDLKGEEDWEWGDEEEEHSFMKTRDIVDHDKVHESVEECLAHCKNEYGWDLKELSRDLKFDIYQSIRFVNWTRKTVAKNKESLDKQQLVDLLREPFKGGKKPEFLQDDELLFPYFEEDPLLPVLCQEVEEMEGGEAGGADGEGEAAGVVETLRAENQLLKEELERQKTLLEAAKSSLLEEDSCTESSSESSDEEPAAARSRSKMGGEEGKKAVIDKHYFESYAKIGIHHEMLSDRVRTESYRSFLLNNPSLVKDKVVLDVGCGTGILSLFAAQAGAKHVYSIDMSDIIDEAREIVRENGMAEKITLIRGKVEEITLPVEKVDLIVSEWMGYFLLYESMLDSVIEARKRFLRPGGACMPDKCSMHITAIEDSERLSFWDDVYGFDMKRMKEKLRRSLSTEGTVDFYKESQVISSTSVINKFDCNVVEVKDLEFVGEFRLEVTRSAKLDALLTYFDIEFAGGCDQVVSFTTGPQERMEEQTHWKQTSFYLDEELEVQQGDIVAGELHCKRHSKNPRALEVLIKWEVKRGEHKVKSKFQTYVVE